MKKKIRKYLNNFLSSFGFKLIKIGAYKKLLSDRIFANEYKFILKYPQGNSSNFITYNEQSKAQLKQDIFVLMELDFKRGGFFIEFGATDGLSLSNTWLLEKKFDWNGILAEPGKCWHDALEKNRSVIIEKDCVWSNTGEQLAFNEVESSSLSTIEGFGDDDNHSESRFIGKKYTVNTISLTDLLKKHKAPNLIDYLSIDTEGSEYIILNHFDFDQYQFKVITVEHNFTAKRKKIYDLLTSKGYKRVHEAYSLFDDWYVLK